MKNSIFLYLAQTHLYWWLRAAMNRVYFWKDTRAFQIQYGVKEKRTNYQYLQRIFSITQKPLFIAVGFAALLQYIDPFFYVYYQKLEISIPDDGDYVTFLATISGIGGIFIGLYYAGISAVGSAIYAKVPNNIRDLLAQERFGNVYMRFLSFLTFLCLILIALRISGFPRVYLAIPLVTLSAGIGVFAFVQLGQRAFYLFDPTKLSHHIFERLHHWLEVVKAGGYQWSNKSFQSHAHRQASKTLDTLGVLADMTAEEPHLSGRPFNELSQNILRFLIYYEYAKRNIPTESAWHEQQYQHHDWYRTEVSRVTIAHQTGTALQPEITANKEWIENRVIPIVKKCIAVNLKGERYNTVLGLLDHVDVYVKRLAGEGGVSRAFALLEGLTLSILGQLAVQTDGELAKEEVLEKVAVVERIASLPISVALGYREMIEGLDRQLIETRVTAIRWNSKTSIYQQDFPAYCLSRLEWFKPRLAFENETEGSYITPLWYRVELVCQVEAERIVDVAEVLVTKGAAIFEAAISLSLSRKHPWLAAAIMSREWEYWHKVEDQIDIWSDKWADISVDRRIEGLSWSEIDMEEIRSGSDGRQHELLKLMSKQNILLALLSHPEGFPDFAGQFLHTSGEVALDALVENDVDLLKSVFEPFLFGCLLRFDSLRPKSATAGWSFQQEFKIAAAALLDIMDVSGYARLLMDYHESEMLWKVVVSAWDKYMSEKREPPPVQVLAAAVAITESAFEIPHRGVLRTAWQQKIAQRLADVPRHETYHGRSFSSDTVIDHSSALIQVFAQEPHCSFHDGIDVFITFYLRKVDGAKDLDFGPKRRDLEETIERQNQRRRKSASEEEPR